MTRINEFKNNADSTYAIIFGIDFTTVEEQIKYFIIKLLSQIESAYKEVICA